jgi:hypothetical protein
MNNVRKTTLTAILVVAAIVCMTVIIPVAVQHGYAIAATYLMVGIGFLGVIPLLDIKLDRVEKGMMIIAFGVVYTSIYPPLVFYPGVEFSTLAPDLQRNLTVFTQVILYACAGAGGSVIAVHADKSSKDNDQQVVSATVIDNTKGLSDLVAMTKHTNAQIQKLYALLAIVALLVVFVGAAVLMVR